MTEEVSLLPLALAEVEREIAIVDSEAERLTTKGSELAVKKRSLEKTLRGLAELLGRVPPEPLSSNTGSFHEGEAASSTSLVSRNAFRYMGSAAAARKLLRKVGHRLTHPEVVEALLRGNVKSKARFPSDSFRTAMLRHKEWFVWKKEPGHFGYWELVEWHQADEALNVTDATTGPKLSLVKS